MRYSLRSLGIVALVASTFSCTNKDLLTAPASTLKAALFKSYVALGNSITAGYQSGGILDSTQQESYAALLAGQAGTRYAYPALAAPGCPPPIVNFRTQARYENGTSTTCALRVPASANAVLNNVAVPGAAAIDPTSVSTPNSNVLTSLILGGKTQVQRALDADPTFVSIWIGNNDVLPAALSGVLIPVAGVSPGITPVDTFETYYAAMMTQLTKARPTLKGLLIGVVNVTAIPSLFPVDSLINNLSLQAQFDSAAGTAVGFAASCPGSGALVSIEVISAIRASQYPPIINCSDTSAFTLSVPKQAAITAAVTAYNTYMSSKADSLGFAYVDVNPLLLQLKAAGQIPARPNFSSGTATFGPFFTLDGVHPSALAHQYIVNALITAINTKYTVSIDTVSHP